MLCKLHLCVCACVSVRLLLLPASSAKGGITITQGPKIRFPPRRGDPLPRFWPNLARSTPPCQILPKSVHDSMSGGVSPPPNKTENFTKFWNINALQWCFPCSISTKLSACTRSAFADWCLKFGRIRSRVSKVIGV